jgi:hypothetical protein
LDLGPPEAAWVASLVRQLTEDDQYLAELVGDPTLHPESAALAVTCFRDDLHWLATLVAVFDHQQAVDFLGRVLLEQEALQREIDNFSAPQTASRAAVRPLDWENLRTAARQLREAAVARQVDALLDRPDPSDCGGWYDAWQSASRLIAHFEHAEGGQHSKALEAVEEIRERAAGRWRECLAKLPSDEARAAVRSAAEDLSDTAAESLTFLEEVPLPVAVHVLETFRGDLKTCLKAADDYDPGNSQCLRQMLRRQRRSLAGELQERRLGLRMQQLFGRRAVEWFERLILVLLAVFLVMLVAEPPLIAYEAQWNPEANESGVVVGLFAWLDLSICLVFLAEFGLKLALAEGRWLYFRRNWLTGLLPSIPFGFLAYATHHLALLVEAGEWLVALRFLRYLRLSRVATWLKIARPALRAFRLVAFLLRASDRLVRRLAPLVNRNLVFFEHATIEELETPQHRALAAVRERFHLRAVEIVKSLRPAARCRLAERRIEDLTAMLSSPQLGRAVLEMPAPTSSARELPAETIVAQLEAATPAGVSEWVSRNVAESIARWCRAFDVLGIRRLPVVRDLVSAGRLSDPYETLARASNRVGQMLEQALDRVYWLADLYGIVTPPQLVDSVGDWMVKGTSRPTRRFLMFGGLFLVVSYVATRMNSETVHLLARQVERLVGTPLIVLGTLCLLPLLLGLWLRQIAGEATEFYTRVAEAQFLAATKRLKQRLAQRWLAFLHRRVLAPEAQIAGSADGICPPTAQAMLQRLWDDYLDGAPFHKSDTRTTTQLLGNLSLLSLRQTRLCYRRSQQKRLARLDLSSTRGSLRGPYVWFHFVSRSLAQQTARLVVDYNAYAIALDRVESADPRHVRAYVEWLAQRLKTPVEELPLPPALAARVASLGSMKTNGNGRRRGRPGEFQGSDFTAIHFLSADPALEAEVRGRYGDVLADLMRLDRRENIRRVMRTYPFHRLPKERRTFNPLAFYERHLAGGWVLLFPFKVAWWTLRLVGRSLALLAGFVIEVLRPSGAEVALEDAPASYAVAVRKVHRMRKPLFMECLHMRAEFDPEYLGVMLPGVPPARGASVPVEDDLALIAADPQMKKEYGRLAVERRRQLQELRKWLCRFEMTGLSAESARAAAIAYTIDYQGARSRLEAARRLRRAFDEACAEASTTGKPRPGGRRFGRVFGRRVKWDRMLDRLFAQPAFSDYAGERREVCREAAWRERKSLGNWVRQLADPNAPDDPVGAARETLLAVARDPATWSQQLLVLRAVQTLSVLDLKTYCDLVAELGEYPGVAEIPGNDAKDQWDRRLAGPQDAIH